MTTRVWFNYNSLITNIKSRNSSLRYQAENKREKPRKRENKKKKEENFKGGASDKKKGPQMLTKEEKG